MSVAPKVEFMQRKKELSSIFGGVTSISVDQKVDLTETLFQNLGFDFVESSNEYAITFNRKDPLQKPDLIAVERSNVFCRSCCKPCHPAEIEYYRPNSTSPEVFVSKKPFRCFECINCFRICAAEINTEFAGEEIGTTTERACTGLTPILDVNVMGQDSGKLSGPSCCLGDLFIRNCCNGENPPPFELTRDGNQRVRSTVYTTRLKKRKNQSKIQDENVALMRKVFTDADNYTIQFIENDMSAEEKLHLLSTVMLLDYLFYEQDGTNLSQGFYCGSFYCNGCIIPIRLDCSNNNRKNNNKN